MAEMAAGTEFGGYRIERLLGAGGFCNVYLAEDLRPALRRKVALKVLNPTLSADQKNRERFQRESLLAVELDDHPNIVGVLDAGEQDGQLFIAQRYIEGTDLGALIERDGPLSADRTIQVMEEIGEALDYAHQAGLVHRDVKPRNVLIRDRDQRCFLADFGLTKRTASSDSLTGAGEFLGTFAYAAPEQLGGEAVDGRADLYALGCVLYESLTGSPPFSGDIHSMITSHLTKAPPSPSQARSGLPPAIDAVITKAMAKEPDDRYQTGAELAEATRKALRATPPPPPPKAAVAPPPPSVTTTTTTSAPPPVTPPPGPLPGATPAPAGGGGRSRTPVIVGAVVVLVLLVVGAVVLLGGGGDDGGSASSTTEDSGQDDQAQADQDLLDGLPSELAATCEAADPEGDAVALAECSPGSGADAVTATLYEDGGELGDAFDAAQADAAQPLDTDGECAVDRYAVHGWTSNDQEGGEVGQVACFLDGQQHAVIAWTDDDAGTLAVASRTDDADASLYEWWSGLVDRAAGGSGDDAFPNGAETELLSHVPADLRDSCVRAELRPQEVASVQCFPESGAQTVFYNQYELVTGAIDEYEALRQAAGVGQYVGATNACPFENALTVDGRRTGRVFCAFNDQGHPYLVWSNRRLQIQSEATAPGTDVAALWAWWTNAGPVA